MILLCHLRTDLPPVAPSRSHDVESEAPDGSRWKIRKELRCRLEERKKYILPYENAAEADQDRLLAVVQSIASNLKERAEALVKDVAYTFSCNGRIISVETK